MTMVAHLGGKCSRRKSGRVRNPTRQRGIFGDGSADRVAIADVESPSTSETAAEPRTTCPPRNIKSTGTQETSWETVVISFTYICTVLLLVSTIKAIQRRYAGFAASLKSMSDRSLLCSVHCALRG